LLAGLAGVALMSGDAVAAQCGKAAWYDLDGQTASGERSNGSMLAAAHRTLPFGTRVRVENLANGRDVIVRINDRGPFVNGRVIDVTRAAADERPAVVDPDDDLAAVGQILDADLGAEGKAAMGGSQARTVGGLAARGLSAEIVPGRLAALRRERAVRHRDAARKPDQQCQNRDPSRLHPAPLP
jgi:hypothetical protein